MNHFPSILARDLARWCGRGGDRALEVYLARAHDARTQALRSSTVASLAGATLELARLSGDAAVGFWRRVDDGARGPAALAGALGLPERAVALLWRRLAAGQVPAAVAGRLFAAPGRAAAAPVLAQIDVALWPERDWVAFDRARDGLAALYGSDAGLVGMPGAARDAAVAGGLAALRRRHGNWAAAQAWFGRHEVVLTGVAEATAGTLGRLVNDLLRPRYGGEPARQALLAAVAGIVGRLGPPALLDLVRKAPSARDTAEAAWRDDVIWSSPAVPAIAGVSVRPLVSAAALRDAGRRHGNCLGSLIGTALSGGLRYFEIVDADGGQSSVLCLGPGSRGGEPWLLVQHEGPNRTRPPVSHLWPAARLRLGCAAVQPPRPGAATLRFLRLSDGDGDVLARRERLWQPWCEAAFGTGVGHGALACMLGLADPASGRPEAVLPRGPDAVLSEPIP